MCGLPHSCFILRNDRLTNGTPWIVLTAWDILVCWWNLLWNTLIIKLSAIAWYCILRDDGLGGIQMIFWTPSQDRDRLSRYGDFVFKIRRSRDRHTFNMGIPILVRHPYIETFPLSHKFHANLTLWWNYFWNNNTCYLSYIADIMPADALATLVARASSGMVLIPNPEYSVSNIRRVKITACTKGKAVLCRKTCLVGLLIRSILIARTLQHECSFSAQNGMNLQSNKTFLL